MSEELNHNSSNEEKTSIFKSETEEYIEENSTIFVKREEPKKKKKSSSENKKKVLLIVVSLVLVVAVTVGIFAIIKFMPTPISDISSTVGIKMIEFDANTIDSVTVMYNNITNTYKKVSSQSTESDEQYIWVIEGIDSQFTSSTQIKGYVDLFSSLTAVSQFEKEEGTDYGFDKPILTANIKSSTGANDYIFIIGKENSSLGEYYVSLNDVCYRMTTASVETLFANNTDFAITTMFEPISSIEVPDYYLSGLLTFFDYISVEGDSLQQPIQISCDKENEAYNYYHMTKPYQRYADGEFLSGFFDMFTNGLYSSGVFSYTHTAEDLLKYGLTNPISELAVKIGDYKIELKVGAAIDGYYPVLFGNNSPIYKVSVTNTSMFFVDAVIEEYVSILLIGDYIKDIANIKLQSDSFDTSIKLIHDKDNADSWTARIDGEQVDVGSVKALYQHIVLAAPITTIFDAEKTEAVLKITLSYTDGSADKVLEFTKSDDGTRRYISWVDGMAQGIVTKDRVDNIINNTEKLLDGEIVNSPI